VGAPFVGAPCAVFLAKADCARGVAVITDVDIMALPSFFTGDVQEARHYSYNARLLKCYGGNMVADKVFLCLSENASYKEKQITQQNVPSWPK
jgi:hypothetical protein